MTLPANFDKSSPANSDSPNFGAFQIRQLIENIQDLLGLPDATNITGPVLSLGALTDGKVATLPWVKAASPFQRLTGTESSAKDVRIIEDAGLLKIEANTGTEVAPVWSSMLTVNLTTGVLTMTGGTTLGGALTVSGALEILIGGFKAILTHANTADRTVTFPDLSGIVCLRGVNDSFAAATALLFRQAAAPTGWTRTVDAGNTDSVIRVLLNSEALADGGSWTVTGLATANHGHTATVSGETDPVAAPSTSFSTGVGTFALLAHSHPATLNGITDTMGPLLVASDGAWRPKHTDVIQATKNA